MFNSQSPQAAEQELFTYHDGEGDNDEADFFFK